MPGFSEPSSQLYKESIALAGIFQSAALVESIARQGDLPEEPFSASIGSIFKLEAASVEDVFGGQVNFIPGLAFGFACLEQNLEQKAGKHPDTLRYVLGLLHLESRLRHNGDLLSVLRKRLEHMESMRNHFDDARENMHDRTIEGLAGIYEDTLGSFRFRIQVTGNRLYLENSTNAAKIRAILLAGIRSAILWHQVGGRRWHLFFYRRRLLEIVSSLT